MIFHINPVKAMTIINDIDNMKSESKIYRFFLGVKNDKSMPFTAILLILVPFLIVGSYYSNREYNALSSNPVFTRTVVSETYIMKGSSSINYTIFVDGKIYKGGCTTGGFSVGDSIGVVYQKDNPDNNMPVFEYYRGSQNGTTIVFVIIIVVFAIYRWRKISREYDGLKFMQEPSRACMIYRTDKGYIFITEYRVNGCYMGSYPIKFVSLECDNNEFENTLMEILDASLYNKFVELKDSELIKAMRQRSWRQLHKNSTSVFVRQTEHALIITPTETVAGKSQRGLDWDYERLQSFSVDNIVWKEIIISIRKLLNDETG